MRKLLNLTSPFGKELAEVVASFCLFDCLQAGKGHMAELRLLRSKSLEQLTMGHECLQDLLP